jgi:hypothetical protein
MRRSSLHNRHPTTNNMRKLTLSHLQPLSNNTASAGYACYRGSFRRRGSDPSQEVRCLTITKEQLTVYLPPTLPHHMVVRAVEDILDCQPYHQNKHSPFPLNRKFSISSSSSSHPPTRHSQLADLHRQVLRSSRQDPTQQMRGILDCVK